MASQTDVEKAYVRRVLKETGWDATTLARKIGASSTTITRPLNKPNHPYGFNAKTLAKIAAESGIPLPPELGGSALGSNLSTSSQAARHESAKNHIGATNFGVTPNVGRRTPAPELGGGARDLKVLGTAVCGEGERGDFRFNGEVVDMVRRPPRLENVRDAFVVYVTGASMEPKFSPGDPAYIHPGQHPRPGDVVLVELHPERDGDAGQALVKVLVSRSDNKIRLKQYNPPNDRIEVASSKVKRVYRVIPYPELLGL